MKGDRLVPAISAASILAKTARDEEMTELDRASFRQRNRYSVKLSLATYGQPLTRHHIVENALSFTIVDRDSSCDMMAERLRGIVQPNVLWTWDDE